MEKMFKRLIDYFMDKLAVALVVFADRLIEAMPEVDEEYNVKITNWPDDDDGGGDDPPPDDDTRPKRTIIVSVETPYYKRIGTQNGKPLIEKDFDIPRASVGTLLEAYVEKTNAIEQDEGATGPILTWELTRDLPGNDIRGLFINAGDAHIRY